MILDDKYIQPILDSPAMPEYVSELNKRMEEEKAKRLDFYNFITPDMKAKFINGEVVIHSPAKDCYTMVVMNLSTLMKVYVLKNKLGLVRAEKALIPFQRNDYQPDICFWNNEKSKEIKPGEHLYPVPNLIVEVLSRSTRSKDKGIKKEDYEAQGVKEYWIIDPRPGKEKIQQFVQGEQGIYGMVAETDDTGVLTSFAIQGFEIKVEAVFDEAKNLEMLAQLMG